MLANLLHVAGVNHVVTIDLHASQMQGFFKCPVDNLHAEPLIARWVRHNVPNWSEAVCVSKNAGGTKRVTSLADALKLNFGMVTTDKRRGGGNMSQSMIMRGLDGYPPELDTDISRLHINTNGTSTGQETIDEPEDEDEPKQEITPPRSGHARQGSGSSQKRGLNGHHATFRRDFNSTAPRSPLSRAETAPPRSTPIEEEAEFIDERAREVTHGRLVHGHIVPDDYPSPTHSAMSSSMILDRPEDDPLEMSRASSFFNAADTFHLGGTADAAATSDEEEEGFQNPGLEQMITLVGDVRGKTVFIVDDMIDKAGSWIAAAECVVKRGGAKKVYCIATHGLFGGDSLEDLQDCDCIDHIVVTNSFPISPDDARAAKKLIILDLSSLLAEAVRRNHYGESISALFTHTYD